MNLSCWKMFHRMRQRSQMPLLQVVVKNYVNGCQHTQCRFTDKKNESSKIKQDSIMLYATYVAAAASVFLGISYYTFKYKKNVYAFNKTQDVQCGKLREDMKTYTLEEVGKHHNKENRIWVTFGQGVYDITEFVDKHPGGSSKILMAAGGSIDPFWSIFANHNTPEIKLLLESMRIGNISEEDAKSNKNDLHDAYANEPSRHKALVINNQKPFCAEPPSIVLVESFHTPNALFYVRNHLPVPEVDLKDYTLELMIEGETKKIINFDTLKKYKKHTITAAVMCGGNRRSEMAKVKKLRGLSWDVGAVGNATWTGVRLCDVLKDLGITNEDEFSHVQFEGCDLDPSGTPYGASIPISKAMDPRGDVILAYEMNGQPLSRDHGFPVRVIVPGVVGARNVKWLNKITVSKQESSSQWQQGDYKGFSPSIDWDNVDFSKSPAIQEMPVISAICSPQDSDTVEVKNGKVEVKGYAWSGGGHKIIRVDITNDKGETWHTANLSAQDLEAKEGRYWSWTLWNVELPVDKNSKETEIWAKAVDSAYNVQPESFKNIYNLRGLLCNAYHRVKIRLKQ